MKRFVLLLALSVIVVGNAVAYVVMSKDVVQKSLTMGREAWVNVCVQDRRKYLCGGRVCEATAERHFKNFCWNYYPTAQKHAFQRKNAANHVYVPVNQK